MLRDRLRDFLNRLSIRRKMTLLYSTSIVLPAVIILIYSSLFSVNLMRREAFKSSLTLFTEVRTDMEEHFRGAEKTAQEISSNVEITRFLAKQFRFSADDIILYRQTISSIVSMAERIQSDTHSGLHLFYTNRSVPENWNNFFLIDRIKDEEWYRHFILSSKDDLWLKLRPSAVPSEYLSSLPSEPSMTYVHKIRDLQLEYQGVIVASLPRDRIFSAINRADDGRSRFYLFDEEGVLFYTSSKGGERIGDIDQESLDLLPGDFDPRDYLHKGAIEPDSFGTMIISAKLRGPGYYLVYYIDTTPFIRSSLKSGIISLFILLMGLFILEGSTYLFVSRIFSRLNAMTDRMDLVASGDFTIRIDEEKKDEIGQIAQDFNSIVERLDTLMREKVRRNVAQKDAQLRNLQMQINPHFIYNTIDTFRMQLVMADQYDLAEQMALFGGMMRYNMSGITTFSTMEEELLHMERYIILQRLRYVDRISLEVSLPESLRKIRILRFVLQPIVENSLKHGIKPGGQIRIEVSGKLNGDYLDIEVKDDGRGMAESVLDELRRRLRSSRAGKEENETDHPRRGVGLANINSRLTLYYGEKSGLWIESRLGEFTLIGFRIPAGRDGKEKQI